MYFAALGLWTLLFLCEPGFIRTVLIDGTASNLSLQLLQVIHRHGDRVPEGTFPNDPNFDKLYEFGFGQLTNRGKQEQYEFGQYLRNEYSYFLNQSYNYQHVRCQSSDIDRTLMSAYSVLAGLYPPQGAQVWNENITWQPIPVHTLPVDIDYMLVINKNCDLRRHITDLARIPLNLKNKKFYNFLSNKTGMNVTDADDLRIISEALNFAKEMNWTVPSWAKRQVKKKIDSIAVKGFNVMLPTKLSQTLAVGTLLKEIVNNMENKTMYQTLDQKQINLYTTHDTVLYGFLSLLDAYNGIKPPMNSAIFVQLLSDVNNDYWVQVLYRNDSNSEPYPLEVMNCSVPCPWDVFLNLSQPLIPVNLTDQCKLLKQLSVHSYIPTAGAVFIVAVLVITSIMLIGIFIHKVKKDKNRGGYVRLM